MERLFTAESLGHPHLLAMLERDEFVPTAMPILAGDKVRFVGEPVAVVIADNAYRAEDAAELRGGVAQGIGGALLEEFGYDEAGQPQAITFIEYRLPTAAEIPPVDVLLSQDAPSPGNPLGVMGAGEGGINAVGAAVANAVRDALGLAGGVGQLPLTPARVCALAQATGGNA